MTTHKKPSGAIVRYTVLILALCATPIWAQMRIVSGPEANDPITQVQFGYLDLSQVRTVGNALESYPHWQSKAWQQEQQDGKTYVIFRGNFQARDAATLFEQKNKYKFWTALKAVRLQPTYDLQEHHRDLAFKIWFHYRGPGNFSVDKAALLLKDPNGQERSETMTVKATVTLLQGLYQKRDPYSILVEGLPYK